MAIELDWDNDEQTILRCDFPRQWTWDEMFDLLKKVRQITDTREYPIGAILDVSKGITIPGGNIFSTETRDNALRMLSLGGNRRGPISIVGGGSMIKMLVGAFTILDRKATEDISYVDSVEEARAELSQRLASLK